MTVYVDQSDKPFGRMIMCHMMADNLGELHAMADAIGVQRRWFQDHKDHPHYDITKSKRLLAVQHGAVEVNNRELVEWNQKRRHPVSVPELSIWYNGSDWVIAADAEDAAKVWEETTGESWAGYADDGEEWEPDNRDTWLVNFEDEDDRKAFSPATAELGKHENGPLWAKATQAQWIEKCGRCFFVSENY